MVKKYALHLQQAMLDKYDDVDIELLNSKGDKRNWMIELHPRFERCPEYQPIIDIEKDYIQPRDDGCLVGISRRAGGTSYDKDHIFLHSSKTGAIWPNPADALEELDRK